MNQYKLKKIYLENFKLISPKGIIIDEFENKDFIVLDGPNGFGKTTIFDALEIAVTGRIHRIFENNVVPGNQGAEDIVYLNDQSKSLRIVVEFNNGSESKIIYVYGESAHNLNKTAKKVNNSDYFQRFELLEFEDYKKNQTALDRIYQSDIDEWLGIQHLDRFYNLYHYIQQEESTFFLKYKEDKRMDRLGNLFDTAKEEKLQEKIRRRLENINSTITELTELQVIKTNELENAQKIIDTEKGDNVIYKEVFKDFQYQPEWDKLKLPEIQFIINEGVTKRDVYKFEIFALIENIENFERNFKNYNAIHTNRKIDNLLNRELIENVLFLYNFIDDLEEIKLLYNQNIRMKKYSEDLKEDNFLRIMNEIDYNVLLEDTGNIDELEAVIEQVEILKSLMNSENSLEQIVREFTETRNDLIELFKKFNSEGSMSDSGCPVCGYEWPEGYEELIENIESKSEKIIKLKSNNSIEMDKQYKSIYKSVIEPLLSSSNAYLEDETKIINNQFFSKLFLSNESQKEVINLLDWLAKNSIDISGYCVIDLKVIPENLDENITQILAMIESKKEYVEESFELMKFSVFYNEVLSNDSNNIRNLSTEDLRNKIAYIEQEYYKSNSERVEILKKQIAFISNVQLKKAIDAHVATSKLLDIYSEGIKKHRRKIAKSIELPFYVISGKILQNYELGNGLFIKMNQSEKTENLKFTQNINTSHDALYSMSSGQLSALVLSFTLAMNKVFDKSAFGVLLIDDPTQTMDEINMASLIDLLRSEFAEKQIILSTHEDEVSHFMRFKFDAFSKDTVPISMKDKQYRLSQLN